MTGKAAAAQYSHSGDIGKRFPLLVNGMKCYAEVFVKLVKAVRQYFSVPCQREMQGMAKLMGENEHAVVSGFPWVIQKYRGLLMYC